MRDMFFAKGRHRPAHFKRWDAQAPYKTEWPKRKDRLGVERRAKPRPKRPPSEPIKPAAGPAEPWLYVEGRWYESLDAALFIERPPHLFLPMLTWQLVGQVWIGMLKLGEWTAMIGCKARHAKELTQALPHGGARDKWDAYATIKAIARRRVLSDRRPGR